MLDRLKAPKGANQKKTRRGRGEGGGLGKTAGKGHKGQNARTGGGVKAGFEGGQMPLQRKLPKHGFTNIFRVENRSVNIGDIAAAFKAGETVDAASLAEKGLIKKKGGPVKVLAGGELTSALTVKANKYSKAAMEKIQAAGGVAEVI